jgi:hypothetical protein
MVHGEPRMKRFEMVAAALIGVWLVALVAYVIGENFWG